MKKDTSFFSKEKVQKILFVGLIVLVFGVFLLSLVMTDSGSEGTKPNPDNTQDNNNENTNNNNNTNNDKEDENQIVKPPVPETKEKYLSPVLNASVFRQFYSLESDEATQEMSLIQYGNKYFMSKGVTYRNENDETFDVLASLSGTVESVTESSAYGNTIIINNGNGVKTEYVGVSNVLVEEGSEVNQGDVIASSGKAEYDVLAGNHLHFKVSIDGKYYDPLKLFNTEK